jgi:hypothetical protein
MKSNILLDHIHLSDKNILSKATLSGETKYGNILFMQDLVKKQAACLA